MGKTPNITSSRFCSARKSIHPSSFASPNWTRNLSRTSNKRIRQRLKSTNLSMFWMKLPEKLFHQFPNISTLRTRTFSGESEISMWRYRWHLMNSLKSATRSSPRNKTIRSTLTLWRLKLTSSQQRQDKSGKTLHFEKTNRWQICLQTIMNRN